tara:strand:- start:6024 stop:6218 length:195 start_codon:yes stop_codon:yes gene_type:complete
MSKLMEFKTEEYECPVAKKYGLTFGLGIGAAFIALAESSILFAVAASCVSVFALYKYIKFTKQQ